MKSKLLLLVIAAALLVGSSASAQIIDTVNVTDTVAIELSVDTVNLSATMQLWVYTDQTVIGATAGFSWGGSPTTHFTMDSAVASPAMVTAFDLGRFFYENSSLGTTNANQRFLFGGTALFSGGLAPQSSRRLWATYYFTISQWDGWNADGIIIDTMTFNSGSVYLFIGSGNRNYLPWFAGSQFFGDPALDAGDTPNDLPSEYALSQNYPNPFNPTTEISFDIPTKSHVTLTVYNILGQAVSTLVDREMTPQKDYTVSWDASEYSTGIYFYKLTAGNFTETRKMLLLK